MSTVTYCDNGHLWDKETGKPCRLCRKEVLARLQQHVDDMEEGMREIHNQFDLLMEELEEEGK